MDCYHRPVLDPSLVAVTDVLATTPGVMFCIKATDGTYLMANLAFAERAGVEGPGDVVGRTAAELFPPELARLYDAQDAEVLATGRMLTNELELITRRDGSTGWFLSSKSRWLGPDGTPGGLVSVSVDLRAPDDAAAPHDRLALAVELARERFADRISVGEMADAAAMTVPQLERSFRRVLGLTPKQLVMRFRLEEALRLLETTDRPLSEIAPLCGYYDQSAFTRHFRRVVGFGPAGWRDHRAVPSNE